MTNRVSGLSGQGRPRGDVDYGRRLRAFEMHIAGMGTTAIAEALGVTRPAVNYWKKADKWTERIYKAEAAVQFQGINSAAEILATMRSKLTKRLVELESLCSPLNDPQVRIQAIKAWFALTKAMEAAQVTDPIRPVGAAAISLEDDLVGTGEEAFVGVPQQSGLEAPTELDLGGGVGLCPSPLEPDRSAPSADDERLPAAESDEHDGSELPFSEPDGSS